LRVEVLLQIDSGYPKDAGVICFSYRLISLPSRYADIVISSALKIFFFLTCCIDTAELFPKCLGGVFVAVLQMVSFDVMCVYLCLCACCCLCVRGGVYVCVNASGYLSIYLSIYLIVCLSKYVYVYSHMYTNIYKNIYTPLYLSIYSSIHQYMCIKEIVGIRNLCVHMYISAQCCLYHCFLISQSSTLTLTDMGWL